MWGNKLPYSPLRRRRCTPPALTYQIPMDRVERLRRSLITVPMVALLG
ncbi:MAG: hypothetical protein RR442_09415 [Muribaculaceae bacterium]